MSKWNEFNTKTVILNKWVQRLMYTAQTSEPPLETNMDCSIDDLIDSVEAATEEIQGVCQAIN